MIKRIVKMTFQPDQADAFEQIFFERKEKIRNFPGCQHLELVREISGNVFFTISLWEAESDLQNYRHSELFKTTWSKVKQMFKEKPQAWSTQIKATLP